MSILNGATRKFIEQALVTETDDCIIWPFSLDQRGYPQAKDKVGQFKPHRRICELAHGAPPTAKHHAAHECGNRPCLNKRHLRWATPQENEHDKYLHGGRRGRRLLDDESVRSIRARVASGEQMKNLAAEHGISGKAVSKIVHWLTYRDVA